MKITLMQYVPTGPRLYIDIAAGLHSTQIICAMWFTVVVLKVSKQEYRAVVYLQFWPRELLGRTPLT